MSRWKRLLEQESEHQWLAFFGFTLIIILGSVVLDWSNDLSGVRDGSVINVDGIVKDSAGDLVLFENDTGIQLDSKFAGIDESSVTCLSEYNEFTYACTADSGVSFIEDGNPLCDNTWCKLTTNSDMTVTEISANELDSIEGSSSSNPALLMIVQDGTSNNIALNLHDSKDSAIIFDGNGELDLDVIIPTESGWLVGGAWKAPPNWLGTNPASPPSFELVISVEWDGQSDPIINVIHTGDEGRIHGIFETDNGFLATGTSDTISISGDAKYAHGLGSYSAIGDKNGDVWLFSGIGSRTVAIISDGAVETEKLPDPMPLMPAFVVCDDEGMISIHGSDSSDNPKAITIDSNARQSFTSIRGILDLGFMLVSMIVIGTMLWNISDAIRKGEVF